MTQHVDVEAGQTPEAGERQASSELELDVEGMTCGTCALRVEKILNRQSGVASASVNFASHRAHVAYDPQAVGVPELQAAVDKIGYRVTPAAPKAAGTTTSGSSGGGCGGSRWHGRWAWRCSLSAWHSGRPRGPGGPRSR